VGRIRRGVRWHTGDENVSENSTEKKTKKKRGVYAISVITSGEEDPEENTDKKP